jgi:hypothetical protein
MDASKHTIVLSLRRAYEPHRTILSGAARLPSPFSYPLESVSHPRVAITIRNIRGGCCHGPIFIGGAFQIGDCEFSERLMIIGHRDPAFSGTGWTGGSARPSQPPVAEIGDGDLVAGRDVGRLQPERANK